MTNFATIPLTYLVWYSTGHKTNRSKSFSERFLYQHLKATVRSIYHNRYQAHNMRNDCTWNNV